MEEEIKKAIIDLINFAKQVSPEVWAVLVKQQIIEGIMGILGWVFSAFVPSFGCYCFLKKPAWVIDESGDSIIGVICVVVGGAIFFVFSLVSLFLFIPQLLNPQYYALMNLIGR